ncbi:hypothetical protein LNTAR_12226 [Lentisphaera araneosa HTCC2155]|uniref:DUF1588 domain-containing protein n=2 Tax=Lentisphaera TaxID=256846 RepID=A6DJP6_9BACT|nr:hypothetical protein LNTAR_12226 [Lentisphaera araneosa HTCC2155]
MMAKESFAPGKYIDKDFDSFGIDFIDNNCTNCHDDDKPDGNLNLLDLEAVNETNVALWKSIWAQVALGEMPPKKKNKLTEIERLEFSEWVVQEVSKTLKDKGGFHVQRDPKKGNFVNHDLLFSPKAGMLKLEPAASPKRIWRITPQEHITRLSILINSEPNFDPQKPGQRTFGDSVPLNHGGELKLYFGADRINSWQGGTVAYATAVKSIPVVLSSMRKHGFSNYAGRLSVNSAESVQILSKAHDILKYMAYGPGSLIKFPEQITDDPTTYQKERLDGDFRGLPMALTYNTKVLRPLTAVHDLLKDPNKKVSEAEIHNAIIYLFEMLTFRPPSQLEVDKYYTLIKSTIDQLGQKDGLLAGLSSLFLDRDALFRTELAKSSVPDKYNRVMLQDWELGLALNHALSYLKPDPSLRKAIMNGKMRSREGVKREITRMLEDDSFRKPRLLQFFREYFDYDLAGFICKDEKALRDAGYMGKNPSKTMFYTLTSTDRLVELILEEDKDVLKQLLTTDKIVAHSTENGFYAEYLSKKEKEAYEIARKKAGKSEKEKAKFNTTISKLDKQITETNEKIANATDKTKKSEAAKKVKKLSQQKKKVEKQYNNPPVPNSLVPEMKGENIYARVGRRSFANGFNDSRRILTQAPKAQRFGILTQPAWLVSHSDAMDNHAIHRGIWIRERLLGGGIPDVPITVDAQLPDEPHNTLRERMRVTREEYCWSCHEKMDPLGLVFEGYNHMGLFRNYEKEKPVNTNGGIIDSGDPALDGPVSGPFELINKLANSERVEQVFVRHAFRFWMGRNETLHDGPILRDAHKAYKENGGSMKALLISLMTSDAFLYRRGEGQEIVMQ